MSNLSQFFALGGGNKIKRIQTVTAQQILIFPTLYTWSGVTASISAVDPTKTLLICSPSSGGFFVYSTGVGGLAGQYNSIGHGAFLSSNTQISFNGPNLSFPAQNIGTPQVISNPAHMVVQVVEFQ